MIRKPLTQEHKDKIGEANRIAKRKFHDANPNFRNSGMFQKGHKKVWSEGEKEKVSGEKSYLWQGGISRARAYKVAKECGWKDLTKCQICGDTNETVKIIIHHIDGNRKNNDAKNLGIVCYACHNAMHDTPNKRATRFQKGHPLNKHEPLEITA